MPTCKANGDRRDYDYRYSMLIVVFARLLGEGWLKEADLEGLREDKLEHIRDMASRW